jgi:hypothetical protein
MGTKVIGKALNYGFAGSYARQPDMIIATRALAGSANVKFGAALIVAADNKVAPVDGTLTADNFIGIASKEVKSALSYLEQGEGEYSPSEPVPVFQRGSINVLTVGAIVPGEAAYIAKADDSGAGTVVGDIVGDAAVSAGTAGNFVKLTNAQFGTNSDANGVAELVLLTRNNA